MLLYKTHNLSDKQQLNARLACPTDLVRLLENYQSEIVEIKLATKFDAKDPLASATLHANYDGRLYILNQVLNFLTTKDD